MKIKTIEINNWRSINNVKIDFENLMIFIGQNNHGKSNILSSILFFFGELNISEQDFKEGENELFVEITFDDLDEIDKNTFKKYLTNEDIFKVRKTVIRGESAKYQGWLETPELDWLKKDLASNFTKRSECEKLPLKQFLPTSGKISKDSFIKAQEKYILANKENIKFNYELETTHFLGYANVAKGMFGEVFYIPSVKEATSEFMPKGNCHFAKLYSKTFQQISDNRPEYQNAKTEFKKLFNLLNPLDEQGNKNINRPPEITSLEEDLTNELGNWGAKINIAVSQPDIDNIFKLETSVTVDDGVITNIERKGNGLQRALIFAILKFLAKSKNNNPKTNVSQSLNRQPSNSNYFIFEEPELFLHPQAQKELLETLKKLSQNNNQVVFCTHSSFFIDLNMYKSICIVRKFNIQDGTLISQCAEDLFKNLDEQKQFQMVNFINPDNGELFFAKKVILVEGKTEKVVIPYLAEKIGQKNYNFSLIECGSKTAIPTYINLLNKFSIPYCVVYDKDHQTYKTQDQKSTSITQTGKISNVIDQRLGYSIEMDNDIEEEIGITERNKKNKPYLALTVIDKQEFELSENLKNKIKNIYKT